MTVLGLGSSLLDKNIVLIIDHMIDINSSTEMYFWLLAASTTEECGFQQTVHTKWLSMCALDAGISNLYVVMVIQIIIF